MTAAGAPTISVIVRSMDRPVLARALAVLPGHPGLLENVALLERRRAGRQ